MVSPEKLYGGTVVLQDGLVGVDRFERGEGREALAVYTPSLNQTVHVSSGRLSEAWLSVAQG